MEEKKNFSLLVVDDEPDCLEALGDSLEKKGFTVFKAATGVSAVKTYKEKMPDLVFLDIKLPDVNGINVFQQIREINPEAKVYFITGNDDIHFREKAAALKVTGYLVKPVALHGLLRIIESIRIEE